MTEWEKTTALIERYLDGELSGEERLAFEEQLEADPLLADELSFHRELRAGIRAAGKEKGFRDELQHIHNELYPGNIREGSGQASGKIEIKSRTYRILAYAAMIAIVISAGSLLTYHLLVNHTKDKELYTELKRMIRETQLKVHNLTPKDSLTEEGAGTFVEGEVQRFAATAFAVNDSGYLVTSFHVLKGARSIEVEIKSDSTRSFHTEMIAGSDTLDLALLKITDQKFKGWAATVPYVFSDAESVLGERVFTLGFPRDDFIYGEGSVSALTGFDQDSLAYQVSIPVNPGNSGAPLINDRGEVSGVITAKNSGEEGASFAIKSGCFLRFMNALNADSTIAPVHLPSRNRLRWLNRTQQVERCKDFVFILKVTCPK